jgi:hypothetical protein
METQIKIPIYRALKLGTENEYVFGVPRQDSKGMYEMIINVVEDGIAGVIQRYIRVDTISIHFPAVSTTSENVWYTMEEISNIIKDYESGKVETN